MIPCHPAFKKMLARSTGIEEHVLKEISHKPHLKICVVLMKPHVFVALTIYFLLIDFFIYAFQHDRKTFINSVCLTACLIVRIPTRVNVLRSLCNLYSKTSITDTFSIPIHICTFLRLNRGHQGIADEFRATEMFVIQRFYCISYWGLLWHGRY